MSDNLESLGAWKPIDESAKNKKCLVRRGSAYAKARWSKAIKEWVYDVNSIDDPLDFIPSEYLER